MALHMLLLLFISFYGTTTAEPVPNYGITLVVPKSTSIAVAVTNLGVTISTLSGSLVGLPASSADADLSRAITALNAVVKNLTTTQTTLKNSIMAAMINTKSVTTVFDAIKAGLAAVSNVVTDADSISTLKSSTGNPAAETIETSLASLSTITASLGSNIADLESGISTAVGSANGGTITATIINTISGTLAETVAKTLTELKTELNKMVAPVKSLVTGIKNAQLYQTGVSISKNGIKTINPITLKALKTFLTLRNDISLTLFPRISTSVKTYLIISDAALKKYLTGTDLATPMEAYSTFKTELTNYLKQVNDDQTQAINNQYSTYATKAEELVTTVTDYPASASANIVSKITNVQKSGSTKAATCQTKIGVPVNTLIAGLPTMLTSCVNDEKLRIDLMNAVAGTLINEPIAIIQVTTNNLVSCGKYPTFAKDKVILAEASSCLTTLTPTIQDIKDTAGEGIDSAALFISDQLTSSIARMDACVKRMFAVFEGSLTELDSQFAAVCE